MKYVPEKQLYQYDQGVYIIVPDEYRNCTAQFYSKSFPDGLAMENEIVDGKILCQIPNQMLVNAESIIVYAFRTGTNIMITESLSKFSVTARPKPPDFVLDPTDTVTYKTASDLIKDMQNAKSEEAKRITAESLRASAETERASSETVRKSSEYKRVEAESDRASAEQARATAETARANSESSREVAETNRANAETSRSKAESSREAAEQDRANAETDRASAEQARITAETERASAESERASAEQLRAAAETERAGFYEGFNSELNSLKSDLDNYFYKELLNAWDKDNRIDGKFYTSNGGALSESDLWCYSEAYVEIKPNTSYEAKCKTSGDVIQNAITSICFYDSDKNFIEHQYDIHPNVSPQNAKYVRISVRTTYTNEFVFSERYNGDKPFGYLYALKDDVYIKKLDEIEKANPLYGKVLCCVGDSITYGADMDTDGITNTSDIKVYNCDGDGNFTETTSGFLKTYGWQIASRNHMTFYNGGVSGSVIASVQSRNGFSLENGRYTKLPENIDYLTLWFGWNDYAEITSGSGLETLGSLSDTDPTTYYGAYNTILDYLTSHYPYTKICVCVPFGANGDIRNATREVANYWGVACWDNTEKNTPLYYNKEYDVSVKQEALDRNRAKFQALGAHPNFKGHTQISYMLEHFLRGI